jgi:hypothetical protein
LSWEDAQAAAGEWIGKQQLGRDLTGQRVDLSQAPMEFEGLFRKMVLTSVARKLKKRHAKEVILPPE